MASLFELLGWIQWGDLEGLKSRESGVFEYSTSKLELIMAMRHLNKQLKVFLQQQMPFEAFAVIGVCQDFIAPQHFASICWLWNGAFHHKLHAGNKTCLIVLGVSGAGNGRKLLPLATGIGED